MKAVYIERFGGPEVLTYGDVPDPVPAEDEVLIDVAAASVNAADWKQRLGSYADLGLPHILGRDVSGTIAAIGAAVTTFRPGDEVFAVSIQGLEGGYAEKIALKERIVGRKPTDRLPRGSRRHGPHRAHRRECARRDTAAAEGRDHPDPRRSRRRGRLRDPVREAYRCAGDGGFAEYVVVPQRHSSRATALAFDLSYHVLASLSTAALYCRCHLTGFRRHNSSRLLQQLSSQVWGVIRINNRAQHDQLRSNPIFIVV